MGTKATKGNEAIHCINPFGNDSMDFIEDPLFHFMIVSVAVRIREKELNNKINIQLLTTVKT